MRGGEYLLSDYEVSDNPGLFKGDNGIEYSIQYYQKKHKNEYVIRNGLGDCSLYENGLLKMIWKEDVDGNRIGEFVSFDKGRISFIQSFDNLLNENGWIRIVNSKRGELMEIWKGDIVIYRGEYNDEFGREGIGIVYNEENGDIEYEGVFVNNRLDRFLKILDGNEMIELYDTGNNLDVVNQIPIYVGGYTVDENDGSFKRDGLGYLISGSSRGAFRECVYENGKEVRGIDLFDGWYHKNSNHLTPSPTTPSSHSSKPIPKPVTESRPVKVQHANQPIFRSSNELNKLNIDITNLIISSNSCNELETLNLNQYRMLKSIEIGNDCFESVNEFRLNGLNELKSLKIGNNSFTHVKKGNWNYDKANNKSRSFSIFNCVKLELIEIGSYSFSDYGGGFELKNLPKLTILKVILSIFVILH